MKFQQINTGYILRLEMGEEIINTLSSFIELKQLTSCTIQAIGSVKNLTLAYYNLNDRKFQEKELEGNYELLTCTGSVGFEKNTPLIHLHSSVSNEEFQVYGGHVISMTTLATIEVVLSTLDTKLSKSYNNTVGLKLFDLKCDFPLNSRE